MKNIITNDIELLFYSLMYYMYITDAGLFSDVLNYVLRMSKNSNISQQSNSAEGEGEEEGGERVKTKPSKRKKTSVPHRREDSTDIATVCVECFKFLKALAKDYTEVQERYM
jgi:hypothetical protein